MERFEKVILTNMCMVFDDNGNVLIEDKQLENGHGLIFPGGHVEEREGLVDSVIREIAEETGLTIEEPRLCGVKDWIEDDGSRYMVFLFTANKYKGVLKPSIEGEVYWLPLVDLKKKKLLWHLEKMLDIFCGDKYSELLFDSRVDKNPQLK